MLLRSILDVIFPRMCVMCGKERLTADEPLVCLQCNTALPRTFSWLNPTDNAVKQQFIARADIDKVVCYLHYQPQTDSTNIIYAMKYKGKDFVARELGAMMAREMRDFFSDIDFIVPVPLSRDRLHERGYNQSEELARGIMRITGTPYIPNLLIRTSFRCSQTQLSQSERIDNVAGAFMLNHDTLRIVSPKGKTKLRAPLTTDFFHSKHLLLLDDVITTCATTLECSRQLLQIPNISLSIASAATPIFSNSHK